MSVRWTSHCTTRGASSIGEYMQSVGDWIAADRGGSQDHQEVSVVRRGELGHYQQLCTIAGSCSKEEILPPETERAESPSTARSLRTRSASSPSSPALVADLSRSAPASSSSTTSLSSSQWPMLDPTPTAARSVFVLTHPSQLSHYSRRTQFFITTVPTPHLDGKHCVFGKVLSGRSTVRLAEDCPVKNDAPDEDIRIDDCGELAEGESDGQPVDPFADGYEEYPSDEESDVQNVSWGVGERGREEAKADLLLDSPTSRWRLPPTSRTAERNSSRRVNLHRPRRSTPRRSAVRPSFLHVPPSQAPTH